MTEQLGPVSVAISDGVATVTVDKPPVNAMGRDVLGGLGEAAERVGSAHEVRAIVLTGTGPAAFMAGADISEFQALRAEPGAMDAHSRMARAVFDAWQALPQPVIAAVQASAVGGGLEIALLCDLIVADPAARFGLPEVKLGLACNMAKVKACDAGLRAADGALQAFGGSGYTEETLMFDRFGYLRLLRSIPVARELALNQIAVAGLGLPRSY